MRLQQLAIRSARQGAELVLDKVSATAPGTSKLMY